MSVVQDTAAIDVSTLRSKIGEVFAFAARVLPEQSAEFAHITQEALDFLDSYPNTQMSAGEVRAYLDRLMWAGSICDLGVLWIMGQLGLGDPIDFRRVLTDGITWEDRVPKKKGGNRKPKS